MNNNLPERELNCPPFNSFQQVLWTKGCNNAKIIHNVIITTAVTARPCFNCNRSEC